MNTQSYLNIYTLTCEYTFIHEHTLKHEHTFIHTWTHTLICVYLELSHIFIVDILYHIFIFCICEWLQKLYRELSTLKGSSSVEIRLFWWCSCIGDNICSFTKTLCNSTSWHFFNQKCWGRVPPIPEDGGCWLLPPWICLTFNYKYICHKEGGECFFF